jgi:hypothetical protein
MYSPLVFDREGKVCGGGMNSHSQTLICHSCGKRWVSSQSDFEIATGVAPEWSEIGGDVLP